MSNTVQRFTERLALTRRPWTAPSFEQPIVLSEPDLKRLGVDRRGRTFYSHKYGELRERPGTVAEDAVPNGPIVAVAEPDGTRRFRTFEVLRPGSYLEETTAPVRTPKVPRPERPIDGLGGLFLASRREERIVPVVTAGAVGPGAISSSAAESSKAYIRPPQPAARGPEELLGRLRRAHASVALSADRASLVVSAAGGRPGPGVPELVEKAGPLLLAYLRGDPLVCRVSAHPTPVPAVTFALGGAPWCGSCSAEAPKAKKGAA